MPGLVEYDLNESHHLLICQTKSGVQSYLTLLGPMDCRPLSSSVHGIFWTKILEWVATSYSRESSQPRDRTHICRERHLGSPSNEEISSKRRFV